MDLDSRGDLAVNASRAVRVFLREGRDAPEELAEEREFEFTNCHEAVEALRQGVADELAAILSLDSFRLRRAVARREASTSWPPVVASSEKCWNCIECGTKASEHCHICGLALCTTPQWPVPRCLVVLPRLARDEAPAKINACRRCADYVRWAAEQWAAEREARADGLRNVLAAKMDSPCLARAFLPPLEAQPKLEKADDCAGCGRFFYQGVVAVPGAMRHHCRACGRTLCAFCICGAVTCTRSPTCPHKGSLPQYGYTEPQRICLKCLRSSEARASARVAVQKLTKTGIKWADHCERVVTYLLDPEKLPKYVQDRVDTHKDKAVRAGSLAVSGVKLLTPFLSPAYALGVNAVHAAWNYGQYGLVGLFCSDEIVQGISTLRSMSKEVENVEPKQLVVGALYLSAEQRRVFRSAPEGDHNLAMEFGKPIDRKLLELLIGLAGVGMHAPYEDKAFEAQRLAAQQNWRLVTHRLDESWKHQPAWCLYVHQDPANKLACIAVRGTDLEKSLGGDLFTDVNALPERAVGSDGVALVAHSGMLRSARRLEPELRQAVRALVAFDHKIVLVGHSLGAGVVTLLVWLLKHGADGECLPDNAQVFGVGYATPCCVDRKTSEAMKPYFTSVVNSVDVVPRLTLTSIKSLTEEIVKCAQESKHDLNADVDSIADRVASVWAPRLRTERAADAAAAAEQSAAAAAAASGTKRGKSRDLSVGGVLKMLSKHTLSSLDLAPDAPASAADVAAPLTDAVAVAPGDAAGDGSPAAFDPMEAWMNAGTAVAAAAADAARALEPMASAAAEVARTAAASAAAVAETAAESAMAAGAAAGAAAVSAATAAGAAATAAGAAASTAALAVGAVGPQEAGGSSSSTAPQDEIFKQEGPRTRMVEAAEGTTLWVPGGPESVKLAWFGNAYQAWNAKEGAGRIVTDEVKAQIGSNNMLHVSIEIFGDPCPRTYKKLFLLVDKTATTEELFCPGAIVWMYRLHGSLRAATVPCDMPALRRIRCDQRCLEDHGKLMYHKALLTVRSRELVEPKVRWQSFADAGRFCPCCHSKYDWQSTTESEKQRWTWMTNCRACGRVVCTACASTRMALPDLGIPDPARVCDGCVWRGPDAEGALRSLPDIFAAAGGSAAACDT